MLDNDTAVMSERGTTELLGVNQMALNRMKTNWLPKTLSPFVDKGFSIETDSVEVIAENSPYKGRKIVVYTAETTSLPHSSFGIIIMKDLGKKESSLLSWVTLGRIRIRGITGSSWSGDMAVDNFSIFSLDAMTYTSPVPPHQNNTTPRQVSFPGTVLRLSIQKGGLAIGSQTTGDTLKNL